MYFLQELTDLTRAITKYVQAITPQPPTSEPPPNTDTLTFSIDNPFGFCPICQHPTVIRTRQGTDTCHNGHSYPSEQSLPTNQPPNK